MYELQQLALSLAEKLESRVSPRSSLADAAEFSAQRRALLQWRDRWINPGGVLDQAAGELTQMQAKRRRDAEEAKSSAAKRTAAEPEQAVEQMLGIESVNLARSLVDGSQRVAKSVMVLVRDQPTSSAHYSDFPDFPLGKLLGILRSQLNQTLGALKETPHPEVDPGVDVEGDRRSQATYFSYLSLDVLRGVVAPLLRGDVLSVERPRWTELPDETKTALLAALKAVGPTRRLWKAVFSRFLLAPDSGQPLMAALFRYDGNDVWYARDTGAGFVTRNITALLREHYSTRYLGTECTLDELGNVVVLTAALPKISEYPDIPGKPTDDLVLLEVRPDGAIQEITRHASFRDALSDYFEFGAFLSAYGGRYAVATTAKAVSSTLVLERKPTAFGSDDEPWTVHNLDLPFGCLLGGNYLYSAAEIDVVNRYTMVRLYRWQLGAVSVVAEPSFAIVLPVKYNNQRLTLSLDPSLNGNIVAASAELAITWSMHTSMGDRE